MTEAIPKRWTVNTIKQAMRAAGSHWFDPDTMRFFKCKILPTVYQGPGGIFFVSSEAYQEESRAYSVRQFKPDTNDIDTVGDFNSMTRAEAIAKAAELSKCSGIAADFGTTTEEYKPVSVVEQFLDDLKKHGTPKKPCDLTRARCLMQLAAKHHEYMKAQCNGTWPYTRMNATADGGHPLEVRECRDSIQEVAKRAGASGVIFSGDPRGCTVKLTFTDGFCNDFGKEGFCVPTGEDE